MMRVVCEGGTGKLTPNFAPTPRSTNLLARKRGQGAVRHCPALAISTVMAKPRPDLEPPVCRSLYQLLARAWRQSMPVELQLPSPNGRDAVPRSKAPSDTLQDGARMPLGHQRDTRCSSRHSHGKSSLVGLLSDTPLCSMPDCHRPVSANSRKTSLIGVFCCP